MDLEIRFKIHTNVSNFDNCKILLCTFYLKEDEMKIAMFVHFKEYHGNHKSVILGQMTNLNMVFRMVVSVYRLVKILIPCPISLMNFGTANYCNLPNVSTCDLNWMAKRIYKSLSNPSITKPVASKQSKTKTYRSLDKLKQTLKPW